MKKGASVFGVLFLLIIIFVGVLFAIPYYQQINDKIEIKKALNMTRDYIKAEPGIQDDTIIQYFFSVLDKKKLTTDVVEQDFQVVRNEGNTFILKVHYIKENILVPILKVRLKDVDKYIETNEFGY